MNKFSIRFLVVIFLLFVHVDAQADPICLGQIIESVEGSDLQLPQRDPLWESHDWLYTTVEGVEVEVCQLCDGPWEPVQVWVAGLEMICPQTGWEIIECLDDRSQCVVRPDYDWDVCQTQILRCPVVVGC
jgi:hypothetical protein